MFFGGGEYAGFCGRCYIKGIEIHEVRNTAHERGYGFASHASLVIGDKCVFNIKCLLGKCIGLGFAHGIALRYIVNFLNLTLYVRDETCVLEELNVVFQPFNRTYFVILVFFVFEVGVFTRWFKAFCHPHSISGGDFLALWKSGKNLCRGRGDVVEYRGIIFRLTYRFIGYALGTRWSQFSCYVLWHYFPPWW